jgi:hypothetical protein
MCCGIRHIVSDWGEVFVQTDSDRCFRNGPGVGHDLSCAADNYKRFADQEHSGAQVDSDVCIHGEAGVRHDLICAAESFTLSVNPGNAKKHFNSGICLEKDLEVAQEMVRAVNTPNCEQIQGRMMPNVMMVSDFPMELDLFNVFEKHGELVIRLLVQC